MKRKIVLRFLLLSVSIILLLLISVKNDGGHSNQNQSPALPSEEKKGVTPKKEPENKNYIPEDIEFPKNFFFGTASSDFQTIGGNGKSDFDRHFEKLGLPGIMPKAEFSFSDSYQKDIDLAEKIGIQIHRLSLDWAKIEPEEGKWDMDTVNRYKKIFKYMQSQGVKPMVCLSHFAIPIWFADIGGWENPKSAYYYSRYAEFVARTIGKPLKIKWWLTHNEPQVLVTEAYISGNWPPYKTIENYIDEKGINRLMNVVANILDSHRLSYRIIHKVLDNPSIKPANKVMVSFASSTHAFYPQDENSDLDKLAYIMMDTLHTMMFDTMIGSSDRDFIGINYYGRYKVHLYISMKAILPWLTEKRPFEIGWEKYVDRKQGGRPKEFYPQALYDLIMKFKDAQCSTGRCSIVVTENGLSDPNDKFREEFIVIHLKAIYNALKAGADVIGYQFWTLSDSPEWNGAPGYFGLISIDDVQKKNRTVRPSAWTFSEIIKTHKITKELLAKHKEFMIK